MPSVTAETDLEDIMVSETRQIQCDLICGSQRVELTEAASIPNGSRQTDKY